VNRDGRDCIAYASINLDCAHKLGRQTVAGAIILREIPLVRIVVFERVVHAGPGVSACGSLLSYGTHCRDSAST
jgi:hypothetical protein